VRALAANDLDLRLVDLPETQHVAAHPFTFPFSPVGPLAFSFAPPSSGVDASVRGGRHNSLGRRTRDHGSRSRRGCALLRRQLPGTGLGALMYVEHDESRWLNKPAVL
jgi:hypothetical protein